MFPTFFRSYWESNFVKETIPVWRKNLSIYQWTDTNKQLSENIQVNLLLGILSFEAEESTDPWLLIIVSIQAKLLLSLRWCNSELELLHKTHVENYCRNTDSVPKSEPFESFRDSSSFPDLQNVASQLVDLALFIY